MVLTAGSRGERAFAGRGQAADASRCAGQQRQVLRPAASGRVGCGPKLLFVIDGLRCSLVRQPAIAPLELGGLDLAEGRWMRYWKTIVVAVGIALLASVGTLAVVAARQSDAWYVQRSATMRAAPEAVFAQLDDFRRWQAWSPWADLDPQAQNRFEGAERGSGAVFSWNGNDKVGEGRMTILESQPPQWLKMKLEFIRPMPDEAQIEFTLVPRGEEVFVRWSMQGQHPNLISKLFCLVMNLDGMIGPDFERGLARLKAVVEQPQARDEA